MFAQAALPAFVDDVASHVEADSPADLIARLDISASIAVEVARFSGCELNFLDGKTELAAALALEHPETFSRASRWPSTAVHLPVHPSLCRRFAAVVPQYKHLGVWQTDTGSLGREVAARHLHNRHVELCLALA